MEHVHLLHEYLDEIKRLIKKTGTIFIAVPNYTSVDAGIYKNYWAAYDVPRHLYHFSPSAMSLLLNQHDLKLKQIRRMWFDSFYIGLLSEKYKTGKTRIVKGFLNGALSNFHSLLNKSRSSSLIYVIEK
jgi:hypothetical protein